MREIWVEREDAGLFAVEDGDGPVVVMLHGGMANHQAALPLIAPLADRYRIVTPDLRGMEGPGTAVIRPSTSSPTTSGFSRFAAVDRARRRAYADSRDGSIS